MNILQTEDLVKGLPDQRLMQEAQNPSGQIPQFLLISEVQRRADMRNRFEQQKPENEGTVSEQILNQGIMGAQPQQPPQHQPPPQMPFPLPQGQGIVPSDQQFPPMQPPNAAILPQGDGMAEGGIVQLQAGGYSGRYDTFAAPWNGLTYNINRTGYPTDQVAWEEFLEGRNEPVGSPRETEGTTTNQISFNPDGSLRQSAEQTAPVNARGWDDITGYSPVAEAEQWMQRNPKTPDPALAQRANDLLNPAPVDTPARRPDQSLVRRANDLLNPAPVDEGIAALLPEAEKESPHKPFFDSVSGYNEMLREKRAGRPPPHDWYESSVASEGTGRERVFDDLDPLFGFFDPSNPKGIHWTDKNQKQKADGAIAGQGATKGVLVGEEAPEDIISGDIPGKEVETSGIAALLPDEDVPVTEEPKTALALLMEQAGRKSPELPSIKDLLHQQQQAAYSSALMQLGAGIAGGDISQGLGRAGVAMSRGTEKARELDLRHRMAGYQGEQGEINRDIAVYGRAAQVEATAQIAARELMRQGRMDRRSVIETAARLTEDMFKDYIPLTEDETGKAKQTEMQETFNELIRTISVQMGVEFESPEAFTGVGTERSKEEILADYGL
jgi:hypothetical protein